MGRILLGDRHAAHRSLLKELLARVDPSLTLIVSGNSEDILRYLVDFANERPRLIILDPSLPSSVPGQLLTIIKSDARFAQIPIVIWTAQAGSDYYMARATGKAAMSIIKPTGPKGWRLLVQKIYRLAIGQDLAGESGQEDRLDTVGPAI
ncbi:MAG TPA: hypothetical protein VFE32_15095 [Puia sp.]|jgi:CheY-like chemotaxis protein|nr:hypothetical protein [Puia sp.]